MSGKQKDQGDLQEVTEAKAAPEVQRSAVIGDSGNQARWNRAQQAHYLGQDESATDLFRESGDKKEGVQKFELFDRDSEELQPEAIVARDWGASLKKGWDRTVQTVQHPDLIGWEKPSEGGDTIYPHRGREDDFVDYDACSKANKAFPFLAKYIGDGSGKIDPELIAATIRNEQFYFDNTKDSGPENYVQKHQSWPFNQDESVGPAQIQVRNMEHLAKTYPKQLGLIADAVRNGIDIHRAPYFVGAYFADVIIGIESKQKPSYISDNIWKQINNHWQKGERNEALIIAYNPDPNQIKHIFAQIDNIKAPDWD